MEKKNPNATFKIVTLVVEEGDEIPWIPTYFFLDDYEEVKWGTDLGNFPSLEDAKSYIQYLEELRKEV